MADMLLDTGMITAYLGSILYYRRLLQQGVEAVNLSHIYRRHQSINRCFIDSPNGALCLTVPIVAVRGKTPVSEICISEHGNWRHKHWNAFCSSYRQTPYFDYYEEDFRPFYCQRTYERLVDFNTDLQNTVLGLIGLLPECSSDKICLEHKHPNGTPYYQIFASKHGFIQDLSIVDLLFNMGPESVYWL